MFKVLTIAFLLLLFYRLIANSGSFLGPSSKSKKEGGDYVDYEEVDSKLKE